MDVNILVYQAYVITMVSSVQGVFEKVLQDNSFASWMLLLYACLAQL